MRVALVAHTQGPIEDEDDRIITNDIYLSLSPRAADMTIIFDQDLSPNQLCTLYGDAALVIATRFHAVVLAIRGGAPVLTIPYFGTKAQGTLRDLGLENLIIEVEDLDAATLRNKVSQCLADTDLQRDRIRTISARLYQTSMHSGFLLNQIITTHKQVSIRSC